MASIQGSIFRSSVIGYLVTGSLVVLPFVLTVLIIGWIIKSIVAVFGPGTWFGAFLTSSGQLFIGQQEGWIAFLIGAVIVLVGLWLLGWAVRTQAQRTLDHAIDGMLAKVPLFRAIYRPVSQVVRVFAGRKADLSGLTVVMCRLGGPEGVDVPGFLASEQAFEVAGVRKLLVYLPTSPLPAWGGLVLVPEPSVIRVPELDADALIKLYFSFGVLAPEIIPPRGLRPAGGGAVSA